MGGCEAISLTLVASFRPAVANQPLDCDSALVCSPVVNGVGDYSYIAIHYSAVGVSGLHEPGLCRS